MRNSGIHPGVTASWRMEGSVAEAGVPDDGSALFPFTPNQLRAIETLDHNLQIVACAGAGKTQVVAERVGEILERDAGKGIRPGNVVAFTFTERAGAELKDRIVERVRLRLGNVNGMAEMYVGTIHGFC